MTQAVDLTTSVFLDDKLHPDAPTIRKKDYILMSVSYDNPWRRSVFKVDRYKPGTKVEDKTWSWFVKFVHPKHNDWTYTFRVMPDGTVKLWRRSM